MIGSCDCCDRQRVPVSRFNATAAYPEGVACFICQGETDPDPYGEIEDSPTVECQRCAGTGLVGVRCSNLSYVGPGPVPDDARGFAEFKCDQCRGAGVVTVDPEAGAPALTSQDRQP